MTTILAIDPGTTESAWVTYASEAHRLTGFDKCPNRALLDLIVNVGGMVAVIERIESYGMPVGAEVFQTVQWTGRFIERMEACGVSWHELPRKAVTLHLCDSVRAKDSNVRQALLDRFPGPLTPSGRPTKGHPLKGVSGDVWAALAVAVTWADQNYRSEP
jgi:hypothetical protein